MVLYLISLTLVQTIVNLLLRCCGSACCHFGSNFRTWHCVLLSRLMFIFVCEEKKNSSVVFFSLFGMAPSSQGERQTEEVEEVTDLEMLRRTFEVSRDAF